MSHHRDTVVDELRNWSRFPKERGTDVAVVFHPQCDQILADVHDESLGGIGLFMEHIEHFAVGQEVEILYQNEFMPARVCHVEPHGNEFIIGFECERGLRAI